MKSRRRFSREGMHFFTILAHPKQRKGRLRDIGGAYVSCWINFRLYEGALELAKFYINENGWSVRKMTEHKWINGRKGVTRTSLKYFREARDGGASFVYHMYPRRAQQGVPALGHLRTP